jgi:hypothetical protein
MTWAGNATGLPTQWQNEKQTMNPLPAYVVFSGPDSIERVGPDYLVYDMTTPGSALPIPTGVRIATVGVRVVSRSQVAGEKAGVYLERARMALLLPTVKDAWGLVNMSLAEAAAIRLYDAPGTGGRMESIAAMTLHLNITPDALTGAADLGTMEQVLLSGAALPLDESPPNPLNLLTPPS